MQYEWINNEVEFEWLKNTINAYLSKLINQMYPTVEHKIGAAFVKR